MSYVFPRRPASFEGFVHREGTSLVDGTGHPLLLRGMGIGNWLLPEGYMWKFGPGAESPREIEALVVRLLGEAPAESFWRRFRDTFFAEADVARIAASGFDHLRLPINSRVIWTDDGQPIAEGLALIDRVIEWCRAHRLWVLLDLHGAPGGQTGTNIDDSPHNLPELFQQPGYRAQTVALWRFLAERYAAETVVMGYDLLNEPIPNEWQHVYRDDLAALYRDITAAIREVDRDHLIVYEGAHWATNWDLFTEVWDENSALQFHKYWSPPDTATIRKFLETRERLQLPIYMGEGGENTTEWLYTAFRLFESHDIGWNFWPWKKIDTVTSPVSITAPDGWDRVLAAVSSGDQVDDAPAIFAQLLENLRLEKCVWRPEVVAAITAQAPAQLPAWGFGFRGEGSSYATENATPLPGLRDDDAVTIVFNAGGSRDVTGNFEQTDGRDYTASELLVVELAAGDWLEYEVDGVTDAAAVFARDAHGAPVPATITATERGLRVTAQQPLRFARLLLP